MAESVLPFEPKQKKQAKQPRTKNPQGGDGPAAPVPKPKSSRSIWILVASLFGGSLLLGAVVFGWGAANSLSIASQNRPLAESTLISMPDYSFSDSAQMPDVRGLAENDAKQALVDAGVPVSIVSVEQRPAAGEPGRVIQQTPVFGVINPSNVTIVVSIGAFVPELLGTSAEEAISELRGLGARVQQVKAYVPGANIGTVTEVQPAAGDALTEIVTVVIADNPSSKPLQEFPRLQGSASSSEDVMHLGKRYATMLSFSASNNRASDYSWTLGARAVRVTGQLALAEDVAAGSSASLVVIGDGNELARLSLSSTSPVPLDINVVGVDALTFRFVGATSTYYSVESLLLDSKVLGSFDAMNATP